MYLFAKRPYPKIQLMLQLVWNSPTRSLTYKELSRQLVEKGSTPGISRYYWLFMVRSLQPQWRLWKTRERVGLIRKDEELPELFLSEVLAPAHFRAYQLIKNKPGVRIKELMKAQKITRQAAYVRVNLVKHQLRDYGLTIENASGYRLARLDTETMNEPS